uniref:NADH-ubiquinone oxidoreductase chain 3 n=1 Tax=Saccostrea cuccullata TaxID=36930 RepID=A0A2H4EC92_9BIVA|nr:NADH dehydrogenase subunit 3 [Saccostrea cucullata]ANK36681.1 NADH dehydrogenase subunit 3 [Saccostrea cucullata]
MLLSMVMIVMVLSVVPIIFSCWFSGLPKEGYDWDKSSPYECGFISVKNPGDFSSRFFHLVILFLVWDVEIVLLVPCFQIYSAGRQKGLVLCCLSLFWFMGCIMS